MDKDLNNLTNINEEFADLRKSFGGNQFVLVSPYNEKPMVMVDLSIKSVHPQNPKFPYRHSCSVSFPHLFVRSLLNYG